MDWTGRKCLSVRWNRQGGIKIWTLVWRTVINVKFRVTLHAMINVSALDLEGGGGAVPSPTVISIFPNHSTILDSTTWYTHSVCVYHQCADNVGNICRHMPLFDNNWIMFENINPFVFFQHITEGQYRLSVKLCYKCPHFCSNVFLRILSLKIVCLQQVVSLLLGLTWSKLSVK